MGSTSLGNLGSNIIPPITVTTDQFLIDYLGNDKHNKYSILTLSGLTGKISEITFEAATDLGTPATVAIANQPAVSILPGGSETIAGEPTEECDDFLFLSYQGCTGRIRGKVIKTGAISN